MKIAIHDSDATGFPNLALMKLSAWHKAQGDSVAWFNPLWKYDKVYSSKVFTFTDEDPYLPEGTIKGGTGYGSFDWLSDGCEHMTPDYSIYPKCDYAIGLLSRGCPRKCKWCIVPEKEGGIKAHACFKEFARSDTKNVVLLDNNPLASEHVLNELEREAGNYKIDFNQGLDARLIDNDVAKILAKQKWFKPVRLACDTKSMMEPVGRAVELLRKHGCTPKAYSCYVLVRDIDDALERVEFLWRLGVDPFAQPYRDFLTDDPPTKAQNKFARWVNHKAIFKTIKWENYK